MQIPLVLTMAVGRYTKRLDFKTNAIHVRNLRYWYIGMNLLYQFLVHMIRVSVLDIDDQTVVKLPVNPFIEKMLNASGAGAQLSALGNMGAMGGMGGVGAMGGMGGAAGPLGALSSFLGGKTKTACDYDLEKVTQLRNSQVRVTFTVFPRVVRRRARSLWSELIIVSMQRV